MSTCFFVNVIIPIDRLCDCIWYMATVSPSSSTVDILFIYFLLFLHWVPLPVIKTICLYIHVKVPCK